MNHQNYKNCPRPRHSPARSTVTLLCSGGLLLVTPIAGTAATFLTVQADEQHDTNSNVFDLPPGAVSGLRPGDTTRRDTFNSYGGTLAGGLSGVRNELTFSLDAHDVKYQHYNELDHTQYRLNGTWKLHVGSRIDGSLGIDRERDMVPFYNLVGTDGNAVPLQRSLQTNQVEHGNINVQLTRLWRLENTVTITNSESPRSGEPTLELQERGGEMTLKYAGFSGLTMGFSGGYSHGSYVGAEKAQDPGYNQTLAQVVAHYSHNPASSIDVSAGYTDRRSPTGTDNLSGLTGLVGYKRQLTPKTGVKLDVTRNISSYITNTGSEIDTSVTGEITWKATGKLALSARYNYTYSQLPHQGPSGSDRLDHDRGAQLQVIYEPFEWLELEPYARWETRTSDFVNAGYSGSVFGIYAHLRYRRGHAPQ